MISFLPSLVLYELIEPLCSSVRIYFIFSFSRGYSPTSDSTLNISSIDSEIEEKETTEVGIQSNLEEHSLWETLESRVVPPARALHLETSKTISIDVPPLLHRGLAFLGQSETIRVDVEPTSYTFDELDSSSYPTSTSMMDKAEDVLRQRIRELEKLEKHLKQQVIVSLVAFVSLVAI